MRFELGVRLRLGLSVRLGLQQFSPGPGMPCRIVVATEASGEMHRAAISEFTPWLNCPSLAPSRGLTARQKHTVGCRRVVVRASASSMCRAIWRCWTLPGAQCRGACCHPLSWASCVVTLLFLPYFPGLTAQAPAHVGSRVCQKHWVRHVALSWPSPAPLEVVQIASLPC